MQDQEYETRQMQVVLVHSMYPTLQWLYLISLDFMLLQLILHVAGNDTKVGWQLLVVWVDDRAGRKGGEVRQKLRGGGGEKGEGWWD